MFLESLLSTCRGRLAQWKNTRFVIIFVFIRPWFKTCRTPSLFQARKQKYRLRKMSEWSRNLENRNSKMLSSSTDVKRNIAYKIGPMTGDDVIYSTTQLYNPTPATFPGNSFRVSQRRIKLLTLRRKAKTIWRACGQE